MINSSKKGQKRRYKRIAAALAGAAVISSALLPSIPIFKVHASPKVDNVSSQTVTKDEYFAAKSSPLKTAREQADKYGFNTNRDRFSLQKRTDNNATVIIRTADGRMYRMELSRHDNRDWRIDSVRPISESTATLSDPVKEVRDNAYRFGFDTDTSKFSLLSLTGLKAVVQVRTTGQDFKVDLIKRQGDWEITAIRGIGNSKYPATYIPASMFPYTSLLPKPVINVGETKVLFSSDKFNGWSWLENTYPADRSFGILLQDPRLSDTADLYPGSVIDSIKNVDFGKNFVLYASLGSASAKGYGIGIEKVVQTGNDFTVTVRAKSPRADQTQPATKFSDYVTLNRASLDFSDPVSITFVDVKGNTLSQYTLRLRF
ncbi:hypothetical protein [Dendrosporobacter sp. 1207_IL3150]|uniref:hypothetical protein n=1 Tax=Dendrosporobacter sp. 1207_IL3150 TaxID=3084054 RepID=UPI002FDA2940